jgi:copper transport protein
MPRRVVPPLTAVRLLATCLATVAVWSVSGGAPASAHNSLLGSDPGAGAVVPVAPALITFDFDQPVPLETLTVTLVDAGGVRSELAGSTHGPAGDTQVVTPLPALGAGDISVRWKLVGPDGHPITGRVEFTIAPPAVTSAPAGAPTVTAATVPGSFATVPATVAPAVVAPADEQSGDAADELGYSTPSAVRWALRFVSYLGIMAAVGVLLVSAFVWAGARSHALLRRATSWSLVTVGVLAFAQLLVLASDISGDAPWASLGSAGAATATDAGTAFVLRAGLAFGLWAVVCRSTIRQPDVFWTAAAIPAIGLLGTWAFAGHSRSMRWPVVGVATDMVHHAAAATWVAGLAIVGLVAIPRLERATLERVVRRFARVAAWSVGLLVVTGVVQVIRLVGGVGALLDGNHGRSLVAKLVVLAVMLAIANTNRQRLGRRLAGDRDDVDVRRGEIQRLQRAVGAELAFGVLIIALTAAMVVSTPAISDDEAVTVVAEP